MRILRIVVSFVVLPLALLWLLFLLGNEVVMPLLTRHGSEFAVPNIVGMAQADAEDTFEPLGLSLQIAGREYSPDKPEGMILTQVPTAGMKVKQGRSIRVIVSAGVRVAEVPDLFGLPIRQADLALQKAGFAIGDMFWTTADSLPENVAVQTIPSKGTVLPLGSSVAVAVNQGTRDNIVFMPALVGLPLERARAVLDSLGLRVAEEGYVRDTLLLPNTVLEQHPTRNTQVEKGDSIWLSISVTD